MRGKAVVMLAVVFAFTGVVAGGDAKTEMKKFAGTWSVVKASEDGKDVPQKEIRESRLTFNGNTVIFNTGARSDKGTFTIDPTKKPSQIDVSVGDEHRPGIYQFKKDTLELCVGQKERPTEFKSTRGTMCVILKRTKK